MLPLPATIIALLRPFARLFTQPVWHHVQILLLGAILCRGARTVAAVLRVMGLGEAKRFEKYHRVLSRARWSGLQGAKILLGLLLLLRPLGWPVVVGIDETVARRGGQRIKAKGCYRDAVRSSEQVVVKCYGLKWISMMLVAGRRGRKPQKGRRKRKALKDRVEEAKRRGKRVEIAWCRGECKEVCLLSGVCLWYRAGLALMPIHWVLVVDPSDKSRPEALFSTDRTMTPQQIVEGFVLRWNVEVTFEESRRHLGVETQRQGIGNCSN